MLPFAFSVPLFTLEGARQSSRHQNRRIQVDGHPDVVTADITQYARCVYTYTAYDGCFDHVYEFTALTLPQVYHQLVNQYSGYQNGKLVVPKVISRKGQQFSFTPGLGDANAVQELTLTIRPDNHLEIRSYDCT